MTQGSSLSRNFDSSLSRAACENLSQLLCPDFPQFEIFSSFERALCEAEHPHKQAAGQVGKKPRNAYKSILAAVVGAQRFNDIPSLFLPVDESLLSVDLIERRHAQAQRLHAMMLGQAEILGLILPCELLSACKDLVEVWQPTMCVPDEYPKALKRAMTAKTLGELPQWFASLGPCLEDASGEDAKMPPKRVVFEALALLAIADCESLTEEIWSSREWAVMRENLGLVAVKMANTRKAADTIRAATILERLYESGILYSGVQLARMYQLVITQKRLDKRRAHELIDEVYDRYIRLGGIGQVFTTSSSDEEMYRMYSTIKVDAIRHSNDEHHVHRLTKHLIEASLTAAGARYEGFSALLLCILAPDFPPMQQADNAEFFALREKISGFPAAEAYCKTMAGKPEIIALQARRWA